MVRFAIGGGGGGIDDGDDPEATPEATSKAGALFRKLGTLARWVQEAATVPSRLLSGTESRAGGTQYGVVGQDVVMLPYTATQKSLAAMGGLNWLYFFVQIGVCGWWVADVSMVHGVW